MSKKLERLNARNNEALREVSDGEENGKIFIKLFFIKIEAETFNGLGQLRFLNLSGTSLGKIPANLFDQLRLTVINSQIN